MIFREKLLTQRYGWLKFCLLLHFVLGGWYAWNLPTWGGVPDEPLHYSHIKYIAEFWHIPYITDPRKFAGNGLADYFFTADPVGTAQHGPIYYWSAAPLFWISKGLSVESQIYVLRFWSLLWGAAMLPLLWDILRRVFGASSRLLGPLLLCATLLPHRLLMSGVIYNDIGSATMLTAAFWALARALDSDSQDAKATLRAWLWVGVALGWAALTKRVALVALPAFLVAIFLQNRYAAQPFSVFAKKSGVFLGAFLAVCGWWFARDVLLYGELFPTEPSIVRRTWSDLLLYASGEELRFMFSFALRGLWLSLWSQVGWLPWEEGGFFGVYSLFVYGGLALGCALVFIGFWRGWRANWNLSRPNIRIWAVVGLLSVAGMVYGALNWVLRYSFHNNEETGKHAISILAATLVVLGLAARALSHEKRAPLLPLAFAALFTFFNVGAMAVLTTILIPRHRPQTPALAKMPVAQLPSGAAPGIWHRYRVPGTAQIGGEVPRPENARPPLNFSDFPTP